MSALMPDCKESHRLVVEGLDRRLRPLERVRLRIHLMMCARCEAFVRQMSLLREAVRRFPGPDP